MDSWQNFELEYIFFKETIFFLNKKIHRKKLTIFSGFFGNFSISFRDFEIFLITRYKENLKIPKGNWKISKKSRKNCQLFAMYFFIEKKYCFFKKYIFQLKILSGIQKSYLEHRAIILKMRKIQNPSFFTQNSGFWWHLVTCYV